MSRISLFNSFKQVSHKLRRFSTLPAASTPSTPSRLIIFDTTLRDGEQSPGATLNPVEKLEIAKLLSEMGVDVCEAGFPIASNGDFLAVKSIAQQVGPLKDTPTGEPMTIAGLSRATEKDISRCYEAVKFAPKHRIHTFLATSDVHLKHKLKISREECLEKVHKAVSFAAKLCQDVEFSCEDAGRTQKEFLLEVANTAIAAGAKTINVPDTVGYTTPEEYYELMKYLVEKSNSAQKNVIFSTHCHNDLGLATANTLAGIRAGCRQVEVTVNGIGERAGNSALEEVIMTLRTRRDLAKTSYPVETKLRTEYITRVSRMVSSFTGLQVQPNKAIVGANAFAHEAGIHQDGVIKHPETYEIMDPKSVGLSTSNLVLGKHSGRAAYKQRLIELGFKDLSEKRVTELVERFKKLADEKKVVTDADIEALTLSSSNVNLPSTWSLQNVHVSSGTFVRSTATVTLKHVDGHLITEACIGQGPVDAIFQTIHKIVRVPNKLVKYQVEGVTSGIDAVGEVMTKLQSPEEITDSPDDRRKLQRTDSGVDLNEKRNPQTGEVNARSFIGHGADTDVLVASAKSYLSALNRMIEHQRMQSALGMNGNGNNGSAIEN